ncbi:MAG: type III secretion inner membrane ring lipoprotein SctJ [Pseudomonadota bacterium]|uniref:type III secretion system inner membrane ring lipoprotein SctJ n=1 Tax=Pseudoalteromonas spongiae TaxID=298657 RepID=UPI000C2D2166|nr:type III secretion inner membrane ring lipoprotein SctJ [Pseudoalteromonas spongiae]MEC8328546.1 type III secretion inner membrane ring lipoprotein SctJ [Pseudomonadota bacterium]
MNRFISVLLACLVLTGCKVDLYSGLDEKQGNEMLALLLVEGVDAEKIADKKGTVKLRVDKNQLSNAIEILSRNSYPRDKFATLSDVFPEGGLISTPTEESARYNYAVSQDLAATVSNIDGVLTARVHLVLPEQDGNKKAKSDANLAKASVFIKHSSNISLDAYIPQIKQMVANSVGGLKYENIAVILFPSVATFNPIAKTSTDVSLGIIQQFKDLGPWLIAAAVLLIIGLRFEKLSGTAKEIYERQQRNG